MNMRVGQSVRLAFSPKNQKGGGARVTGAVSWRSSDESVVAVEPDPSNPLQAVATARECGAVLVAAFADAELAEGQQRPVGGALAIVVIGRGLHAGFELTSTHRPE